MADLKETIESVATGPAEASGDNITVKQQNIKDLIEADKYLAGKTGATRKGFGLRIQKMNPPSAV
jgi:hypothetical protein